MVRWEWNQRKGFYLIKGQVDKDKLFRVNIYSGNCLGVEIYEFKDENGQEMYEFQGFWNDEKHLENCLGLNVKALCGKNNIYEDVTEIHLFTKYSGWEKIARRFAKAKIKVVLEYEETTEEREEE